MSLYEDYLTKYPDLLGHLENARNRGRLSHAFLVHADSEQVRRDFAVVLAQLATCPNIHAGRPCLTCQICRWLEEGNYSEFYTLSPIGKTYVIKIGERINPEPNTLRYFENRFYLTGTGGGDCKIGVIYDADRMNDESQNALLKTLEEPPSDTLLILVTGNPSALLPTTRSRCQQVSLLANHCEYDFAWGKELFATLGVLCFGADRDLVRVEEGCSRLTGIASDLSRDAEERTAEAWAERVETVAQSGDASQTKRIEQQVADVASGAYMRERGLFLSAIQAFCQQVFLLSEGIALEQLPNPEIFEGIMLPASITPERGIAVLREADDLNNTLNFNVNEELALRTFALNLAMK